MPVPELIRDSFIGQLVYYASGRRLFNYLEDRPEFILPVKYEFATSRLDTPPSDASSDNATLSDRRKGDQMVTEKKPETVTERPVLTTDRPELEESTVGQELLRSPTRDVEKGKLAEEQQKRAEEDQENPFLVTWYGPDDPESPQNVRLNLLPIL